MWNKLTRKSSDVGSESGSRRRKTESSSSRRRPESVVSTSSRRDRDADKDDEKSRRRTSRAHSYPEPAPSEASSYATARTERTRGSESGRRERSSRYGEDDRNRAYSYEGAQIDDSRRDRSLERDRGDRSDDTPRKRQSTRGIQDESDYRSEKRSIQPEERDTTRSRGVADDTPKRSSSRREESSRGPLDAHVQHQFPGQDPTSFNRPFGVPQPQTPSHSIQHDAHVQSQFPGQDPASFDRPFGAAADYYGDQGQSVDHQPGIRPSTPKITAGNAQPHLMTAHAVSTPAPDTGNGSAADFFNPNSAYGPPPAASPANTSSSRPNRPSKTNSRPSKPSTSSSSNAIGTTAALAGAAAAGYGLSQLSHQESTSSMQAQYAQSVSGSTYGTNGMSALPPTMSGKPAPRPGSTSARPSASSSYNTTGAGRPPYESSNSNLAGYATAAGVAAGAYALHQHHSHSHQSNQQSSSSNYHAGVNGSSSAHYTNGANGNNGSSYNSGMMAQQQRPRGPLGKLADWWKDYEDVQKMEEYSQYIGVCRDCFEPGTSSRDVLRDGPRTHHYHGPQPRKRRSGELRQSEEFKRSSRVNKTARYERKSEYASSSDEGRKGYGSWVAAGLGAYGLGKVAQAFGAENRSDSRSVRRKSSRGTLTARSRSTSRERRTTARRDSSYDRKERTSGTKYGYERSSRRQSSDRVDVVKGDDSSYRIERRHAAKTRSRSRSRDRHDNILGAAAGAAIAGAALSASGRSGRRRSNDRIQMYDRSDSDGRQLSRGAGSSRMSVAESTTSSGLRRRKSQEKKKRGFFSFGNGSSSSEGGLSYGVDVRGERRQARQQGRTKRRTSDEKLNATILGIGATAAALAAAQKGKTPRTRPSQASLGSEVVAVKQRKSRESDRRRRRLNGGPSSADDEESAWQDVSEEERMSDGMSGLAYGDFTGKARRSTDSLVSHDSGTSNWFWRWPRKKKRKPSSDSLNNAGSSILPAAALAGAAAAGTMIAGRRQDRYDAPSAVSDQPSMQSVYPVPTGDPYAYDAHRRSHTSSTQQPLYTSASGSLPLQQPQPIVPIGNGVYHPQLTHANTWTAPTGPPVDFADGSIRHDSVDFTRRTSDSERRSSRRLSRRASSPPQTSILKDAALVAGAAGATAAALSMSKRNRDSQPSPSAVRFDLNEQQQDKERELDRERRRKDDERRRQQEEDDRRQRRKEEDERQRRQEEDDRRRRHQREKEEAEAAAAAAAALLVAKEAKEKADREREAEAERQREAERRSRDKEREQAREAREAERRERRRQREEQEKRDAEARALEDERRQAREAAEARALEDDRRRQRLEDEAIERRRVQEQERRDTELRDLEARRRQREEDDRLQAAAQETERERFVREEETRRSRDAAAHDHPLPDDSESKRRRQESIDRELEETEAELRRLRERSGRSDDRSSTVAAGVAGVAAAAVAAGLYKVSKSDDRKKKSREEEIADEEFVPKIINPEIVGTRVAPSTVVEPKNEARHVEPSKVAVDTFDDDFDPDFFKKRRAAREAEIAQRAAEKVRELNDTDEMFDDFQNRYTERKVDQGDFFAPDILKDKSVPAPVSNSNADADVQVWHVPTTGRPPYEPEYAFVASKDGKSDSSSWGVPKLNLIEPTPPASRINTPIVKAKDLHDPVSPSHEPVPDDEAGDVSSFAPMERSNSKVTWGENETYHYDVPTPMSHHGSREQLGHGGRQSVAEPADAERPVFTQDSETPVEETRRGDDYFGIDKSKTPIVEAESPAATPVMDTPDNDRTPIQERDLSKGMPGGFVDDELPETPAEDINVAPSATSKQEPEPVDEDEEWALPSKSKKSKSKDKKEKKSKKGKKSTVEDFDQDESPEKSSTFNDIAKAALPTAAVGLVGAVAHHELEEKRETPEATGYNAFDYLERSEEPTSYAESDHPRDRDLADSGYVSRQMTIPDPTQEQARELDSAKAAIETQDDDFEYADKRKKKKDKKDKKDKKRRDQEEDNASTLVEAVPEPVAPVQEPEWEETPRKSKSKSKKSKQKDYFDDLAPTPAGDAIARDEPENLETPYTPHIIGEFPEPTPDVVEEEPEESQRSSRRRDAQNDDIEDPSSRNNVERERSESRHDKKSRKSSSRRNTQDDFDDAASTTSDKRRSKAEDETEALAEPTPEPEDDPKRRKSSSRRSTQDDYFDDTASISSSKRRSRRHDDDEDRGSEKTSRSEESETRHKKSSSRKSTVDENDDDTASVRSSKRRSKRDDDDDTASVRSSKHRSRRDDDDTASVASYRSSTSKSSKAAGILGLFRSKSDDKKSDDKEKSSSSKSRSSRDVEEDDDKEKRRKKRSSRHGSDDDNDSRRREERDVSDVESTRSSRRKHKHRSRDDSKDRDEHRSSRYDDQPPDDDARSHISSSSKRRDEDESFLGERAEEAVPLPEPDSDKDEEKKSALADVVLPAAAAAAAYALVSQSKKKGKKSKVVDEEREMAAEGQDEPVEEPIAPTRDLIDPPRERSRELDTSLDSEIETQSVEPTYANVAESKTLDEDHNEPEVSTAVHDEPLSPDNLRRIEVQPESARPREEPGVSDVRDIEPAEKLHDDAVHDRNLQGFSSAEEAASLPVVTSLDELPELPLSRPSSPYEEPRHPRTPPHLNLQHQRANSATAIPLRFRRPLFSPAGDSPLTMPRIRHSKSSSWDAKAPPRFRGGEIKPLYLAERARKAPETTEETLPPLPESREGSRTATPSELQPVDDPLDRFMHSPAHEDLDPFHSFQFPAAEEKQPSILGSQHTTPRALPVNDESAVEPVALDESETTMRSASRDPEESNSLDAAGVEEHVPSHPDQSLALEKAQPAEVPLESADEPQSTRESEVAHELPQEHSDKGDLALVAGAALTGVAAYAAHEAERPGRRTQLEDDFMAGEPSETEEKSDVTKSPRVLRSVEEDLFPPVRPALTRKGSSKKGKKGKKSQFVPLTDDNESAEMTAEDHQRLREQDAADALDGWDQKPSQSTADDLPHEEVISTPRKVSEPPPVPAALLQRTTSKGKKKKGKKSGRSSAFDDEEPAPLQDDTADAAETASASVEVLDRPEEPLKEEAHSMPEDGVATPLLDDQPHIERSDEPDAELEEDAYQQGEETESSPRDIAEREIDEAPVVEDQIVALNTDPLPSPKEPKNTLQEEELSPLPSTKKSKGKKGKKNREESWLDEDVASAPTKDAEEPSLPSAEASHDRGLSEDPQAQLIDVPAASDAFIVSSKKGKGKKNKKKQALDWEDDASEQPQDHPVPADIANDQSAEASEQPRDLSEEPESFTPAGKKAKAKGKKSKKNQAFDWDDEISTKLEEEQPPAIEALPLTEALEQSEITEEKLREAPGEADSFVLPAKKSKGKKIKKKQTFDWDTETPVEPEDENQANTTADDVEKPVDELNREESGLVKPDAEAAIDEEPKAEQSTITADVPDVSNDADVPKERDEPTAIRDSLEPEQANEAPAVVDVFSLPMTKPKKKDKKKKSRAALSWDDEPEPSGLAENTTPEVVESKDIGDDQPTSHVIEDAPVEASVGEPVASRDDEDPEVPQITESASEVQPDDTEDQVIVPSVAKGKKGKKKKKFDAWEDVPEEHAPTPLEEPIVNEAETATQTLEDPMSRDDKSEPLAPALAGAAVAGAAIIAASVHDDEFATPQKKAKGKKNKKKQAFDWDDFADEPPQATQITEEKSAKDAKPEEPVEEAAELREQPTEDRDAFEDPIDQAPTEPEVDEAAAREVSTTEAPQDDQVPQVGVDDADEPFHLPVKKGKSKKGKKKQAFSWDDIPDESSSAIAEPTHDNSQDYPADKGEEGEEPAAVFEEAARQAPTEPQLTSEQTSVDESVKAEEPTPNEPEAAAIDEDDAFQVQPKKGKGKKSKRKQAFSWDDLPDEPAASSRELLEETPIEPAHPELPDDELSTSAGPTIEDVAHEEAVDQPVQESEQLKEQDEAVENTQDQQTTSKSSESIDDNVFEFSQPSQKKIKGKKGKKKQMVTWDDEDPLSGASPADQGDQLGLSDDIPPSVETEQSADREVSSHSASEQVNEGPLDEGIVQPSMVSGNDLEFSQATGKKSKGKKGKKQQSFVWDDPPAEPESVEEQQEPAASPRSESRGTDNDIIEPSIATDVAPITAESTVEPTQASTQIEDDEFKPTGKKAKKNKKRQNLQWEEAPSDLVESEPPQIESDHPVHDDTARLDNAERAEVTQPSTVSESIPREIVDDQGIETLPVDDDAFSLPIKKAKGKKGKKKQALAWEDDVAEDPQFVEPVDTSTKDLTGLEEDIDTKESNTTPATNTDNADNLASRSDDPVSKALEDDFDASFSQSGNKKKDKKSKKKARQFDPWAEEAEEQTITADSAVATQRPTLEQQTDALDEAQSAEQAQEEPVPLTDLPQDTQEKSDEHDAGALHGGEDATETFALPVSSKKDKKSKKKQRQADFWQDEAGSHDSEAAKPQPEITAAPTDSGDLAKAEDQSNLLPEPETGDAEPSSLDEPAEVFSSAEIPGDRTVLDQESEDASTYSLKKSKKDKKAKKKQRQLDLWADEPSTEPQPTGEEQSRESILDADDNEPSTSVPEQDEPAEAITPAALVENTPGAFPLDEPEDEIPLPVSGKKKKKDKKGRKSQLQEESWMSGSDQSNAPNDDQITAEAPDHPAETARISPDSPEKDELESPDIPHDNDGHDESAQPEEYVEPEPEPVSSSSKSKKDKKKKKKALDMWEPDEPQQLENSSSEPGAVLAEDLQDQPGEEVVDSSSSNKKVKGKGKKRQKVDLWEDAVPVAAFVAAGAVAADTATSDSHNATAANEDGAGERHTGPEQTASTLDSAGPPVEEESSQLPREAEASAEEANQDVPAEELLPDAHLRSNDMEQQATFPESTNVVRSELDHTSEQSTHDELSTEVKGASSQPTHLDEAELSLEDVDKSIPANDLNRDTDQDNVADIDTQRSSESNLDQEEHEEVVQDTLAANMAGPDPSPPDETPTTSDAIDAVEPTETAPPSTMEFAQEQQPDEDDSFWAFKPSKKDKKKKGKKAQPIDLDKSGNADSAEALISEARVKSQEEIDNELGTEQSSDVREVSSQDVVPEDLWSTGKSAGKKAKKKAKKNQAAWFDFDEPAQSRGLETEPAVEGAKDEPNDRIEAASYENRDAVEETIADVPTNENIAKDDDAALWDTLPSKKSKKQKKGGNTEPKQDAQDRDDLIVEAEPSESIVPISESTEFRSGPGVPVATSEPPIDDELAAESLTHEIEEGDAHSHPAEHDFGPIQSSEEPSNLEGPSTQNQQDLDVGTRGMDEPLMAAVSRKKKKTKKPTQFEEQPSDETDLITVESAGQYGTLIQDLEPDLLREAQDHDQIAFQPVEPAAEDEWADFASKKSKKKGKKSAKFSPLQDLPAEDAAASSTSDNQADEAPAPEQIAIASDTAALSSSSELIDPLELVTRQSRDEDTASERVNILSGKGKKKKGKKSKLARAWDETPVEPQDQDILAGADPQPNRQVPTEESPVQDEPSREGTEISSHIAPAGASFDEHYPQEGESVPPLELTEPVQPEEANVEDEWALQPVKKSKKGKKGKATAPSAATVLGSLAAVEAITSRSNDNHEVREQPSDHAIDSTRDRDTEEIQVDDLVDAAETEVARSENEVPTGASESPPEVERKDDNRFGGIQDASGALGDDSAPQDEWPEVTKKGKKAKKAKAKRMNLDFGTIADGPTESTDAPLVADDIPERGSEPRNEMPQDTDEIENVDVEPIQIPRQDTIAASQQLESLQEIKSFAVHDNNVDIDEKPDIAEKMDVDLPDEAVDIVSPKPVELLSEQLHEDREADPEDPAEAEPELERQKDTLEDTSIQAVKEPAPRGQEEMSRSNEDKMPDDYSASIAQGPEELNAFTVAKTVKDKKGKRSKKSRALDWTEEPEELVDEISAQATPAAEPDAQDEWSLPPKKSKKDKKKGKKLMLSDESPELTDAPVDYEAEPVESSTDPTAAPEEAPQDPLDASEPTQREIPADEWALPSKKSKKDKKKGKKSAQEDAFELPKEPADRNTQAADSLLETSGQLEEPMQDTETANEALARDDAVDEWAMPSKKSKKDKKKSKKFAWIDDTEAAGAEQNSSAEAEANAFVQPTDDNYPDPLRDLKNDDGDLLSSQAPESAVIDIPSEIHSVSEDAQTALEDSEGAGSISVVNEPVVADPEIMSDTQPRIEESAFAEPEDWADYGKKKKKKGKREKSAPETTVASSSMFGVETPRDDEQLESGVGGMEIDSQPIAEEWPAFSEKKKKKGKKAKLQEMEEIPSTPPIVEEARRTIEEPDHSANDETEHVPPVQEESDVVLPEVAELDDSVQPMSEASVEEGQGSMIESRSDADHHDLKADSGVQSPSIERRTYEPEVMDEPRKMPEEPFEAPIQEPSNETEDFAWVGSKNKKKKGKREVAPVNEPSVELDLNTHGLNNDSDRERSLNDRIGDDTAVNTTEDGQAEAAVAPEDSTQQAVEGLPLSAPADQDTVEEPEFSTKRSKKDKKKAKGLRRSEDIELDAATIGAVAALSGGAALLAAGTRSSDQAIDLPTADRQIDSDEGFVNTAKKSKKDKKNGRNLTGFEDAGDVSEPPAQIDNSRSTEEDVNSLHQTDVAQVAEGREEGQEYADANNIEAEVPEAVAMANESQDPHAPYGTREEVRMDDEFPVIVKKSKKDKKKAKKFADFDEETPAGDTAMNAQAPMIEVDPAGATEELTASRELPAQPAADDEWPDSSFATKKSKKDKKKAKKNALFDVEVAAPPRDENLQNVDTPIASHERSAIDIDDKAQLEPESREADVDDLINASQHSAEHRSVVDASVASESKGSAFEPATILLDPVFSRPSSRSGVLEEATFDELPLQASRMSSRHGSRRASRRNSTHVVESNEAADMKEKPPQANDADFAAALTAGLQGAGFNPDMVQDRQLEHNVDADEPEFTEYHRQDSKKAKKSKKKARAIQDSADDTTTPDILQTEDREKQAYNDQLGSESAAHTDRGLDLHKAETIQQATLNEPERSIDDEWALPVKKSRKGKKGAKEKMVEAKLSKLQPTTPSGTDRSMQEASGEMREPSARHDESHGSEIATGLLAAGALAAASTMIDADHEEIDTRNPSGERPKRKAPPRQNSIAHTAKRPSISERSIRQEHLTEPANVKSSAERQRDSAILIDEPMHDRSLTPPDQTNIRDSGFHEGPRTPALTKEPSETFERHEQATHHTARDPMKVQVEVPDDWDVTVGSESPPKDHGSRGRPSSNEPRVHHEHAHGNQSTREVHESSSGGAGSALRPTDLHPTTPSSQRHASAHLDTISEHSPESPLARRSRHIDRTDHLKDNQGGDNVNESHDHHSQRAALAPALAAVGMAAAVHGNSHTGQAPHSPSFQHAGSRKVSPSTHVRSPSVASDRFVNMSRLRSPELRSSSAMSIRSMTSVRSDKSIRRVSDSADLRAANKAGETYLRSTGAKFSPPAPQPSRSPDYFNTPASTHTGSTARGLGMEGYLVGLDENKLLQYEYQC